MFKLTLFRKRFKLQSIHHIRRMCERPKVIVRSVDDDFLDITFRYGNEISKERQFSFHRSKQEILQNFFARINSSIIAAAKRNKRKKCNSAEEVPNLELVVKLKYNDKIFNDDTKNVDAFKEGAILYIGDTTYNVAVNIPTVKSITLPSVIMAGFPVYPILQLEFASRENCQFIWYKLLTKYEKQQHKKEGSLTNIITSIIGTWAEVERKYVYLPDSSDIDRKLKVVCHPKSGSREGIEVSVDSQCVVSAGPGQCPFEERHIYTKRQTTMGRFRCVSYNVLAEMYGDTDFSRDVLYPTCPPYALCMDYRKQLLLKEIIGYNADIICLQEVDNKIFQNDFFPFFKELNFDGILALKGTSILEGTAIFYHLSKFRLLFSETILLSDVLRTNNNFADLYAKVSENEKLKERVFARNNVLQMVLLESVEEIGKRLLVGNTHLYFQPDADHIRLLQATICLKYLELKLQQLVKENPNASTSLVLCGDFNSCPEFAVYQLATTGQVSAESPAWKSNEEESVSGIAINHSLQLESACGCPEYTNYTIGFQGCLDYIFYDTIHLKVEEYVPFPTDEQVKQHTALPSIVFPSDHLALISTLQWK